MTLKTDDEYKKEIIGKINRSIHEFICINSSFKASYVVFNDEKEIVNIDKLGDTICFTINFRNNFKFAIPVNQINEPINDIIYFNNPKTGKYYKFGLPYYRYLHTNIIDFLCYSYFYYLRNWDEIIREKLIEIGKDPKYEILKDENDSLNKIVKVFDGEDYPCKCEYHNDPKFYVKSEDLLITSKRKQLCSDYYSLEIIKV